MIEKSLLDLMYGFGIAFEPHNLMWSIFGVIAGNLIGVLPGLGALTAIAILLPLTYVMHPVAAILMLSGIFLRLDVRRRHRRHPAQPSGTPAPCRGVPGRLPAHQTGSRRRSPGGGDDGLVVAASIGILVMVFCSPLLVDVAFKFGPAELFSIMLLGCLPAPPWPRARPSRVWP